MVDENEQKKKLLQFAIHGALYEETPISEPMNAGGLVYNGDLNYLLKQGHKVDMFCPECQKERVFDQIDKHERADSSALDYIEVLHMKFACSANAGHAFHAFFNRSDLTLRKIGQHPSVKDIQDPEFNQFKNVLTNEKFLELKTAIGLFSHGVGIGSFVYLRRVVEHLIEEAHTVATEDADWDEEKYQEKQSARERIGLLKDHLPPFLVKNPHWYSIVSKGVHELSEDECKAQFPMVRNAIKLILAERKRAIDLREEERAVERAMQKAMQTQNSSPEKKTTSKEDEPKS